MTVQPLSCQVEAARFATTLPEAEARAERIRRNDLAEVLGLIKLGRRGRAHAVLMQSFGAQARALGLHLHQTERGSW